MIKKINSDFIILLVTFLLFMIFTFLPSYIPDSSEQMWKNYYLLCVKENFNYKEHMNGVFWEHIISFENAETSFTVFDDMETVKLKNLHDRFDKRDPRLDPYMKALQNYFFGPDSWDYMYIPADTPVLYVFLNLYFSLPGYGANWVISEFNLSREILSVLFTAVFLLLIINIKKKNRIFTAFSFIPWLIIILSGSFYDLISFFIIFPAVFLVTDIGVDLLNTKIYFPHKLIKDNPDFSNLKGRLLYLALAVLINIAGRFGTPGIIRVIFPVFSYFSMMALYYYFNKLRLKRKSHDIFFPVSIVKEKKWGNLRKSVLISIGVFFIVVPVVFSLEAPLSEITVPVPENIAEASDFSFSSLSKLNNYKKDNVIPDISDFVIHSAFQAGFVYGKEYTMPQLNEEILLDSYRENSETGEIEKYYEVVMTFNDIWLNELLNSLKKRSIEKMLFDQGQPVHISYNKKDMYFDNFSLCFGLLVFVLFPLFFMDSLWTSKRIYGNKDNKHKQTKRKT